MSRADLVPVQATSSRIDVELLKDTIAQDTTDAELRLFVAVCERTGLDPFARQIHAVKRWNNEAGRKVMTIQTSIDGLRLIAQRTGEMAGLEGPQWCGPDGVWRDVWLDTEHRPAAARVVVYRRGHERGYPAVAHWSEYVQTDRNGNTLATWGRMPAHMLAKCAEALGLRKAFPAELAGVDTPEEHGRTGNLPSTPAARTELSEDLQDLLVRYRALPDDLQHGIEEQLRERTGVDDDTVASVLVDVDDGEIDDGWARWLNHVVEHAERGLASTDHTSVNTGTASGLGTPEESSVGDEQGDPPDGPPPDGGSPTTTTTIEMPSEAELEAIDDVDELLALAADLGCADLVAGLDTADDIRHALNQTRPF